jgi:hypothetical protein
MRREIDILVKAVAKRCAVVEKASQTYWTPEQLAEANNAGRFQEISDLLPPDRHLEAAGPFPACFPPGDRQRTYHPVGQTRHFLIFAALEPEVQPDPVRRKQP